MVVNMPHVPDIKFRMKKKNYIYIYRDVCVRLHSFQLDIGA